MTGDFAASVSAWAAAEKDRVEAVFQTAAQMVFNEVRVTVNEGGRLPIDLGNLRRSFMASTASMPTIRDGSDQSFPDGGPMSEMVIGEARIGQTVWIGAQSSYALRMEFGFVGADSLGRVYNQTGFGFVTAVAQRWPQIVAEAEAKVKGRFEGGSPQA